jgi:hypothetical protein
LNPGAAAKLVGSSSGLRARRVFGFHLIAYHMSKETAIGVSLVTFAGESNMKTNVLFLSFAVGLILCTNALAQQTYERDPVPPRHGGAERMEPVELRSKTPLREFPSDIFFPSDITSVRHV